MDAGGHTNLSCPIEARSYEFRSTENKADERTGQSSSLGPGPPGCERENRGFVTDAGSLLTISSLNEIHVDPCRDDASSANAAGSPHTPRDGVFDPFAPRPGGLGFAPLCTLLNGGSVICPGAPVKPASKPRNIDLKLGRRLEF